MDHAAIQRRLSTLGYYSGAIDGKFGPISKAAALQCLTDGPDHPITDSDIAQAAAQLGGTAAQAWAVYDSESTGRAFINGLPAILPEPHRFSRSTGHSFDKTHPRLSSRAWNKKLYPSSQAARWTMLMDMVALNVDAGFMSASYGGFQILGENYDVCGAIDPWSFAWKQCQTEGDQLEAFVRFVEGRDLKRAFQQISDDPETCRPFARGYNGTAYAANDYHVRIAKAHERRRAA